MKSLLSMVFEAGIPSKITKKKTNILKIMALQMII